VLLYGPVFHSIGESIGCLSLDEVLGQPDKDPLDQLLNGYGVF
jgi:hypothetical protein